MSAVAISWLRDKFDSAPQRADLAWLELVERLSKPRISKCTAITCGRNECVHKNGPSWSPATFGNGLARKKENVESLSLLVVDLDHLTDETLRTAEAMLRRYRRILHSSHSDNSTDRCVRAVVALSRPVTRAEWPVFWPAAMTELGQPADPSCCDANRLYYLPSRPFDADYYFASYEGEPLDVDAILDRAPRTAPSLVRQLTLDESGTVQPGERHAMLKSLAGAVRSRGAGLVEIAAALTAANSARCIPPKSDSEIRDLASWAAAQPITTLRKVSSRDDDPGDLNDVGEEVPPPGDDDAPPKIKKTKGRDAVQLANRYVEQHATHVDGVTLRRWRGDWYQWLEPRGCYAQLTDEQVEADLYRRAGLGKRSEVGDVRHALIAVDDVLIDHVELGDSLDADVQSPAVDRTACRNGVLHLPTCTLTPATPRYFATSSLGVAYDPAAPVPARWLAFLTQLWPDDEESVQALQEWIGYQLTPDTRQQKIAMLIGPKRSGKGTILRVVTELLGAANVVSPTLASLGSNFGLSPWIGRTAAIIGDARLGGRSDIAQIVERLLSISGEDGQTIDRKHRKQWTGRLTTRITIVSNELPRFNDASDALPSRMLMLELRESWFGKEDPGLTDALITELPGILRWAIAGWQRLRKRGHFVQPESSREAIDDLADLGSPVAAWVRQRCETRGLDRAFWLRCDDAYEDFKSWCEKNGNKVVMTNTVFGSAVKSATGCQRKHVAKGWTYAGLVLR